MNKNLNTYKCKLLMVKFSKQLHYLQEFVGGYEYFF